MKDDVLSRYPILSGRDTETDNSSRLFVAFGPTKEDCFGWTLSMTGRHESGEQEELSRTIWTNPVSCNSRVLVDVYITSSKEAAGDCLLDILSRNHLRILPKGPDDLGNQSFIYPKTEPHYVCWVRDNLCIVASSFGKELVKVDELARRLDTRLVGPLEAQESCLELHVEKSPIKVGTEAKIGYWLPWKIDESLYLKFESAEAELFLKDQSVNLRPTVLGDARIVGFASQEGGLRCFGTAVIRAD